MRWSQVESRPQAATLIEQPERQKGSCKSGQWGTYKRWACTAGQDFLIRVQRIRCQVCGRTHGLLHPYRHYVLRLLQKAIHLYLIAGLGLDCLLQRMSEPGPSRSTVREWIRSFAYGAGERLLDRLTRRLVALDPLALLPDRAPPEHLQPIPDPVQHRRLARAHRFWLLARHLYAQVKLRQPWLDFEAAQFFPFLLHWLQRQTVPPRLLWAPRLSTPTTPRASPARSTLLLGATEPSTRTTSSVFPSTSKARLPDPLSYPTPEAQSGPLFWPHSPPTQFGQTALKQCGL